MSGPFPPILPQTDIQHVVSLVQKAYGGQVISPSEQKQIQNDLLEIQRRPEAWGLVIPMLQSSDSSVQFFGAHTAQIKAARDWNSVPEEHRLDLKDTILRLSAHAVVQKQTKITVRKLYVAINSVAFKTATGHPAIWDNWIQASITSMLSFGVANSDILDFLTIVAEEFATADLLKAEKSRLQQIMINFVPHLSQAVLLSLSSPDEVPSALKCLQAWVFWGLPANYLVDFIPVLIRLLSDPAYFIEASDVLQEILSSSVLSDGSGSKSLSTPLLEWISVHGRELFDFTKGGQEEISLSLCKLLVALGDHSTAYIATTLGSPQTQAFLGFMLSYTSLPGYYGVDEDESEMTLNFWFRLQEEIWNADFSANHYEPLDGVLDGFADLEPARDSTTITGGDEQWQFALDIYRKLIQVLRCKVTWPPATQLASWLKDQRQKFSVYRRDVGDTLINAYYILRDELLKYYVDDLVATLTQMTSPTGPWETIEATLHCICSVHEAVPILDNPSLAKLFSADVLGRLPSQGAHAVRQTALSLIGAYSTWFPNQESALLMGCVSYIVGALHEPTLSLLAANALKDICDANRSRLTSHMGDFGMLYANMSNIPDTEKPKIVQSIASVIEALEPQDAIEPISAIVSPLVAKAFETLDMSSQLPDEARQICLHQLEAISRCAQGLTKNTDALFVLDEPAPQEMEAIYRARADQRISTLHDNLLKLVEGVLTVWASDALISDSVSELLKSITALPSDTTILTLPSAPLLNIVTTALQRSPNAIWLTQASRLVLQLNPPTLFSPLKPVPSKAAYDQLSIVLPSLIRSAFVSIGTPALMEENPDVVKSFFECLDVVSQNFVRVFFSLPEELFIGVMNCSITALSLQERYSLVKSCTFLNTFCNQLLADTELETQALLVMTTYGKGIVHAAVSGIAGAAPRSVLQNLVELLTNVVSKRRAEAKQWIEEILYSNSFVARGVPDEAKRQFSEAIISSRSTRRTREAAQQFAIVARGLEGSSFGYATGTGTGAGMGVM